MFFFVFVFVFVFLNREKEGKLTEEAEFDGLGQSWLELVSSLDWNYEGNSIKALYQFEILMKKVAYTLLSTLDSMKALYLRDNFHYKMNSLPWPIGIFRNQSEVHSTGVQKLVEHAKDQTMEQNF